MDCPICLDLIDDNMASLVNCDHHFHKQCIDTWLKINPTCPLCRTTTLFDFKGHQYFRKNHFLNCSLSIESGDLFKINYNNNYKAIININKIKNIQNIKNFTIIRFNYSNEIVELKFKLYKAYYFLEFFRGYVSKRNRVLNI
jgi:hypothetical protein